MNETTRPHAHAAEAGALSGLRGLVLGVANEHSIAWGVLRHLRESGAQLWCTALNAKAVAAVQPLCDGLGVPLRACNVAVPGELAAVVDEAAAALGGLDFVVHAIAWAPLAELHGRVADASGPGFAQAMTISCHSFAELARLAAPHMAQGGSLVTMSYHGAAAVEPNYGLMGPVKAALESTVRYLAAELGPQGIRVHAVSPGPVPTRAASGIVAFDELMRSAEEASPLGRLVSLQEIAAITAFLCSRASSGMTGQTIYVDAGAHIMGYGAATRPRVRAAEAPRSHLPISEVSA